MTPRRGQPKPAHLRGNYHVRSRAVRDQAWGNPATRCWRCHRTIAEVRAQGEPTAVWHAGHLVDGQIGGELRAECSPCNTSAGGRLAHALKHVSAPLRRP